MDEKIHDFVRCEKVAVVGVSSSRTKFGSAAGRELKKRGYEVYPVNPNLDAFEGGRCYRSLVDIGNGVEAALVVVKPSQAVSVVEDASRAGIKKLWFQQGADFSEAIKKAGDCGIATISGKCLLMYAPPVTGFHSFHRFLAKLFGRY